MTILGIDLGTTFSAASIVRDGKPILLPLGNDRIVPSVVSLSTDNQWLVGRPALNQVVLHPERTVRSIKRKMGTNETVTLGAQAYTPQQISSLILQALKSNAEQVLQQEVKQAVITVPAFFSDRQRNATRDAGLMAGLEVMRIINEPTAAALAYGLEEAQDQIALVYDLGGGTFDVSLVEMVGGVVDVRASHGNTQLGGDDFDERLAQWLIGEFESQHGVDLRGNTQALARIRRAAENAKIELSSHPFVWVHEEYLAVRGAQSLHMEIEVSRTQFLSLIDDLLMSMLDSVERVLEDSKIERPDHILLVGGSTYIPAVRELVAEHVGVAPRYDVNPSEAVALGAGIQGAIIAGEPIDAILVDITPYSMGIAVAEMLPFGQIVEDRYKVLIPRNSTIPISQEEAFAALFPDQTSVKIEVYQGESRIASENTLLGDFFFENLKPEVIGEPPRFTVRFDLDINGILNVQTVDRGSKKQSGIQVKASHQRLNQSEIQSAQLPEPLAQATLPDAMIREAEHLLGRTERFTDERLDPLIDDVMAGLQSGDEDELQTALDALNDLLFDLDE